MLSHDVSKLVEKLIIESSFVKANHDLHTIYVDFGRRFGCEMMNAEHNLGLNVTDITLYDPTHV